MALIGRVSRLLRADLHALLEEREREIRQSLSSCESELDLCFEHGRETLARDLIRRRLEAAELLKALLARHARVVKSCGELNAAIEQNHSRLEAIRQKAELLAAERFEEPADDCRYHLDSRVLEQQVELELLREKQKRGVA